MAHKSKKPVLPKPSKRRHKASKCPSTSEGGPARLRCSADSPPDLPYCEPTLFDQTPKPKPNSPS